VVLNYLIYVALAIPERFLLRCDAVVAMTDPPFERHRRSHSCLFQRKPYVYNLAICIRTWRWVAPLSTRTRSSGACVGKTAPLALRRSTRVIALLRRYGVARIIAKGIDPANNIEIARDGSEFSRLNVPPSAFWEDDEFIRPIRAASAARLYSLFTPEIWVSTARGRLRQAAKQFWSGGVGSRLRSEGGPRERVEKTLQKDQKTCDFPSFFPSDKILIRAGAADAHVNQTVRRGLEGVVVPAAKCCNPRRRKGVVPSRRRQQTQFPLGGEVRFAISADPDNPGERQPPPVPVHLYGRCQVQSMGARPGRGRADS